MNRDGYIVTALILEEDRQEKTEKQEKTLRSLEEQTIGIASIEVLYVSDTEELKEALEKAEGSYIHILERDISFSPHTYERAVACLSGQKAAIGILPLRKTDGQADGSEDFPKAASCKLKDDYSFLHPCCYGYFFRKDAVNLPDKEYVPVLALSVWKVLYGMITEESLLPVVPEVFCQIPSADYLDSFWEKILTEEGIRIFIQQFLFPLRSHLYTMNPQAVMHGKYIIIHCITQLEQRISSIEAIDNASMEKIKDAVDQLLQSIASPELISTHRALTIDQRRYFLQKFHGEEFSAAQSCLKAEPYYDETESKCRIHFLKMGNGKLEIWGSVALFGKEAFSVEIRNEETLYDASMLPKTETVQWFGETILARRYFQAEIRLSKEESYSFQIICRRNKREIPQKHLIFERFAPLDESLDLFYRMDGWLMYYHPQDSSICLRQDTWSNRLRLALKTGCSLLSLKKMGIKSICSRLFSYCIMKESRRIWLLSDGGERAGGNGESLFAHLQAHPVENVETYYLLPRESEDYERLKALGKVVEPYSWKHKFYHLCSEYILTSRLEETVLNPFRSVSRCYKDIMADDLFIYLPEEPLTEDCSGQLNRYEKNLVGIVVSAKEEYHSLLTYDYYYTPREIWLTGSPGQDKDGSCCEKILEKLI